MPVDVIDGERRSESSPQTPIVSIDLRSQAFHNRPTQVFAEMRTVGPVLRVKMPLLGTVWAATTYASCEAVLKANDLFVMEGRHAGKRGAAGFQMWLPETLRLLLDSMLMKDEPEHRRLRKLVDHAFGRRNILVMRADIDALADRIIDEFKGDVVDLIPALCRRLPTDVISDLLGIPHADRAQFGRWAMAFSTVRGAFDLPRLFTNVRRMAGYLRGEIESCRRAPKPGLISELVAAEHDGEQLSENELLAMVFLLMTAGFETTNTLIGDSILELDRHPEQKAWLLADPAARMERAVEELARFNSPLQSTKPRFVAQDHEFFGRRLKRGDVIIPILGSANHDPAIFDDPEALRLDRFPNPHLVFSTGVHFCLGLQLARLETQCALSRLYARYPDLKIINSDKPDWTERILVHGLRSLPARLGRQAA